MYKVRLFLFFSLIQHGVDATLTPSGPTVSVDCGGQQTFTCAVTGSGALWTITRLNGITATGNNGLAVRSSSNRVTTTDSSGAVQTSTITITGFTTADDGGTVECINQNDNGVQGMTAVLVGPPQCGVVGVDYGNDSCPAYTFENSQGSPQPSTVVVSYQIAADPSSAGSLNCDYPVDPRMCRLAVPEGTYAVTLTPQNSCGSPSRTCSSFTEIVQSNCTITVQTPKEDLSGLYSLLVPPLLLLIIITYSISVAVVWHLYYKDYNYCQVYWCCCFCKPREGDGKIRTSSTEPMKASSPPPPPPAAAPLGEYADPKDVRKRKEENKIQYADLEFTKQSGGGQGTIHQKEEPVTYTAIQHA